MVYEVTRLSPIIQGGTFRVNWPPFAKGMWLLAGRISDGNLVKIGQAIQGYDDASKFKMAAVRHLVVLNGVTAAPQKGDWWPGASLM